MAIHISSDIDTESWRRVPRPYAWLVFALTFGLLLSDYMSRQVLNAVFPLLKSEWALSDTQLGSLSSVVSIAVGLFAFPLSLFADRWGRIRSLIIMAALWSLATLCCGLASDYNTLAMARFFVGLGEAAYASVGLAVILSLFPPHQRSAATGAFMAGSMVGSVLGIGLGGVLATHWGWRPSFIGMATYGMLLTILFAAFVKPKRLGQASGNTGAGMPIRPPLRTLFSTRSVVSVYIGCGVQLFIPGAMIAWLPSYLNRFYSLPISRAGAVAAIFVLASAAGMVICGYLADRLCHGAPQRKIALATWACLICCSVLAVAFQLPPGVPQLVLIAIGMFFGASIVGPTGTMISNLTPAPIHSTAMATSALANNLLGFAPGPIVIGVLADRFGLATALQLMPMAGAVAALAYMTGVRSYHGDLVRVRAQLVA